MVKQRNLFSNQVDILKDESELPKPKAKTPKKKSFAPLFGEHEPAGQLNIIEQLAAQARHEREERIKAGIPDGYVKSDGKPSGYLTKSQVKDFNSKPLEERKRILGS